MTAVGHHAASRSLVGGMLIQMDQFVCGLTGHDELMRFEPERLSLRCTRCGHQSAGWEVRSPRSAVISKIASFDRRPMLERVT